LGENVQGREKNLNLKTSHQILEIKKIAGAEDLLFSATEINFHHQKGYCPLALSSLNRSAQNEKGHHT
jgi:hypothetical protein